MYADLLVVMQERNHVIQPREDDVFSIEGILPEEQLEDSMVVVSATSTVNAHTGLQCVCSHVAIHVQIFCAIVISPGPHMILRQQSPTCVEKCESHSYTCHTFFFRS